MNFFNKLLNNRKKETKNTIKPITMRQSNMLDIVVLNIHPDIENFIWFGDGKRKNYIPKKNVYNKIIIDGITIQLSFLDEEEPSLIYTNLPIKIDSTIVEKPPYFPTYKGLTPEQKGIYWKFLSNPYDSNIDTGYVFILYYGLERFLLSDNYEKVIDIILNLRDVHKNKSFQSYSANAIILTCLMRQRADLVIKFMKSLDKDHEYNFSSNLFLLCKYSLNLSLTVTDIIRLAKSFEFTKTTYIKNYPDLFAKQLKINIKEKYHQDEIPCKKLLSKAEFNKLPRQKTPIFANISIHDKDIDVPQILSSFKFKKDIYFLLEKTHSEIKNKLAKLRKERISIEKKEVPKKSIKVPTFDTILETNLLSDYKKANPATIDQHFALINLQDFYYKYRNLGNKYLQLCIDYCIEDIANLEIMQHNYCIEEKKRIKNLSFLSKEEKNDELNKVIAFTGTIPAFKRLAIIYEKSKDYNKAIDICDQAIKYYNSIDMLSQVDEFQNRKDKLFKKKTKIAK